ncbi:UNVERIFIED_CONTAM: hypothetical protein RF648_19870 [Kocuria sp. CPCC 205274]
MEDLIDNGFVEEKEKHVITSRSILKGLCQEYGITNECRALNEYPSFVRFMDKGNTEAAEQMLHQWIEDDHHTSI